MAGHPLPSTFRSRATPRIAWGASLVVLWGALLGAAGCRRKPLQRGGAAVVFATPKYDAASAPAVMEQEPNDTREQAHTLAVTAPPFRAQVAGKLLASAAAGAARPDEDLFRLQLPAMPQAHGVPVDGGHDPRQHAWRLSLDVAWSGKGRLSMRVLDASMKQVHEVSAVGGESVSMPNLAVPAATTCYVLLTRDDTAKRKGAVSREPADAESPYYTLAVEVGRLEPGDELEPNDDLATANAVERVGGIDLAGYYGWQRDQDYYRLPAPAVPSALDLSVDAVEGVSAGLLVLDGAGKRIAAARGRRGGNVALANVRAPTASVDGGASERSYVVVVRSEAGVNRDQRYVLHLSVGAFKSGWEIEPNDTPALAMPIGDGAVSGLLPLGDVDVFRYEPQGGRDLTVRLECPARVRCKVEIQRARDGQVLGSGEAKKAREPVDLPVLRGVAEPLIVRISPARNDGHPTEPYTLAIASAPVVPAGNP